MRQHVFSISVIDMYRIHLDIEIRVFDRSQYKGSVDLDLFFEF